MARLLLVLLAVCFQLLPGLGVDDVQAGALGCTPGPTNTCDQGQAYAMCMAYAQSKTSGTYAYPYCTLAASLYTGKVCNAAGGTGTCVGTSGDWQYAFVSSCASRPAYSGGWAIVGSGGNYCVDGCAFNPGSAGGVVMSTTIGGKTYANTSGGLPTGAVCGGSDLPSQALTNDDCQQIGGLTQCVKPDGRHCVVASNGRQLCWKPSEAGTKQDGNVAGTKAPEGAAINAPNNRPPNGGDWQQSGSGTVSTGGSGGTVNNYNVVTWNSTYGAEGDGTPDGNGGEGEENNGGPSASGGAQCNSQPTCSDMGSVECNQLIQTWYLRCKGVDLTGGDTCDAPPQCTGDAGTCFVGATLWRMRCDGVGGDGDLDAIGKGQEEIAVGEGDGTEDPDIAGVSEGDFPEVKDLWVEQDGNEFMDQLDASGFLSDRSCPTLSSWSVAGHSFSISLQPMCQLATSVGALVLALSYWIGFRIIAKAHS